MLTFVDLQEVALAFPSELTIYLLLLFHSGKFPIGVTKYLFWPGTSFASRITSTHHLWTIPLVLWASGGMHFLSLPLSAFVVVSNVLLSRFMTPRSIILKNNHDKNEEKYLNINMAHELWRGMFVCF